MSKPLFIWAGGKNKMLKHYIPILPSPLEMSIKSYVEPFFGGGAMFIHIMKHHQPKEVYINDINPDIVSIYECIKNNYNEFLKRVIDLETQYLPMNMEDRRKFFFKIRHDHAYEYENWSKPYESATLYFLMKTAFNGIFQINQNTNNRYGTPCGL
jgi:DNA adenine methylase